MRCGNVSPLSERPAAVKDRYDICPLRQPSLFERGSGLAGLHGYFRFFRSSTTSFPADPVTLTQAINNDQRFTVEVSEKGRGRPEYQMLVRIFPTKADRKSNPGNP